MMQDYGDIIRPLVTQPLSNQCQYGKIDVKSIYIMDFHDASIEIEQETIKNEL